MDKIEKTKYILKESSQCVHHYNNNMAHEYILYNDELYLLGVNCISINNVFYLYDESKEDSKWEKMDKYIRCYGLDLQNIISLLCNFNNKVISVNYITNEYSYSNYYLLTLIDKHDRIQTFRFKPFANLRDFESSELCYYLYDLYKNLNA